jgi:hypothetical protein
MLEDGFKHTFQRPAAKAAKDRVPLPELLIEIAPRRAGADDSQHGLDEQPVVCPAATRIARLAWKQRCNPFPLPIAQNAPIHGWSPFSSLESSFADQRNPP